VQLSSPNTVANFLQRMGRSGRRGNVPEMICVFREEQQVAGTPLPQIIPWMLIKAIAIVQLYVEERFIEPPKIKQLPFSLLYHQTLGILASSGELLPADLAQRVLTLHPFEYVTKDDYKILLKHLIKTGHIETTDEGGLIIGLKGERIINNFKFLSVFVETDDYTVRCDSEEIGTITTPPPVGDRFALAGRVWEVKELDVQRRLIFVDPVKGKMEVEWPGDAGEVHTRILERMRQVLVEDTEYPYLKPHARARLEEARSVARSSGMLERPMVSLGGSSWCLFPWLGTRSFKTLRRFITAKCGTKFKISNVEYDSCFFLTFQMQEGNDYELMRYINSYIDVHGLNTQELMGPNEQPVYDKYDSYIPAELLRKAYAADKLWDAEVPGRVKQLMEMY